MHERLVNVLFKEPDYKGNILKPGTVTMAELYGEGEYIYVTYTGEDASLDVKDLRMVRRRDFHIVDMSTRQSDKPKAIVCDIDGVLNYIPKKVVGTNHRAFVQLPNGENAQWTELNKTAQAVPNLVNFKMLADFAERGMKIIFLTARGDTQRVQTDEFLRAGFAAAGYVTPDYLTFMRGFGGNDVPAPGLKVQQMQACILPYFDVVYFVDDCPKNITEVKNVCPQVPCMHLLQ